MADGIDRRAQIDQDTVKALLLINGGGAVALLTLLPDILEKDDLKPLAVAILWGISILIVGLVLAIVHNRLRRVCSLVYENHAMRPPHGTLFGISLGEPGVCFTSHACMWGSVIAFVIAASLISISGIRTLGEDKISAGKVAAERVAPASKQSSP